MRSFLIFLAGVGLLVGCDRAAPGGNTNDNGNAGNNNNGYCEPTCFVDFPCGVGAACVLDASELMVDNSTYGCEMLCPDECCSGAGCSVFTDHCQAGTVCAYPDVDPLSFQLDSGYQGGGDRPQCVEVDQVCGGAEGRPCRAGEYCELVGALCPEGEAYPDSCVGAELFGANNFCEYADAGGYGYCRPQPAPDSCATEPVAEVCGCDGVTYDNDCLRRAAGMVLRALGPCPE